MSVAAQLYFGKVFHRRLRPKRHELSYRVFYMLIDIDHVSEIATRHRFFAYNRFGLFSFYDRDHGPSIDRPLRPWVEAQLARAGILPGGGGHIDLLTFPRVLGFVFVPLSIYYCHDQAGDLAAVIYEVNNTFGDRHSYLIPVRNKSKRRHVHECDKAFFVSPFVPVKGRYHFKLTQPEAQLSVVIRESDESGALLTAAFTGERHDFSDKSLLLAFVKYPLMTLKIVVAIHWEAALLFRKGLGLIARSAAPSSPVSIQARPDQTSLNGTKSRLSA
ncbi:MAG: DUF1365 domain-containing protein [Parvibaculum sp.]